MKLFYKKLYLIFCFLILILSCDRELSITKFEEDYSSYEGEIRIEAIMNTTNLEESIVRVDSTMLVTDTTTFNERDDDNDGEVDEPDEVVSQVHVTNMKVALYNSRGSKVMEFKWDPKAEKVIYGEFNNKSFKYGGYVPDEIYIDTVDYSQDYEFRIMNNVDTISGTFTPVPPVKFETKDTLLFSPGSDHVINWKGSSEQRVCMLSIYKKYLNTSQRLNTIPWTRDPNNRDTSNVWEGNFPIDSYLKLPPGLYKFEVGIPSPDYGQYFYSQLPIKDPKLNNFRDQDGNVILGIAGAISVNTRYFIIKK